MPGQTYTVNYIVNVDAANAQTAINSFKRAVSSMQTATKPITDLQRQVRGLMDTLSVLGKRSYTVKIETKPATQKIGKLIRALQMAKAEVTQLNAMGVTLGGAATKKPKAASSKASTAAAAGAGAASGRNSSARTSSTTRTVPASAIRTTPRVPGPTNLGYKLWGPTPLPNNGGMAIDMLKGMGIAYGIAGLGTLISNVVNQAVEYDNTMKTVENILKSHDIAPDFTDRFNSMATVVRDVGMKTKYKVTEVADAAKFLAMAGFDVQAISQAISPIADIALVGDTELGKTADVVTNIMTAYNIAPGQMRKAADVMTNTFTMSNTTLTEIAEAYKYAASLLSAGGVSFEESTAAIGVLGDAGIKGSQAGTTMRTIMANIANPTKKQRAGWEEIGINLKDENGKRKDLLEIFKELQAKNLDVDAFYRIFHKTAASGAVALAAHADKWENVYLENFLAGGMTRQLAEEKQNTLQGLWAQLTSVFTDRGVTAFSGVQGQIRGLLQSAINWLKTPRASEVFKDVSKTMMEFVHTLIEATKWFADLMKMFGPAIKLWMKFQLMIWPVVKAVTALRSVMLGLLGLRKVGFMIGGLAGSFRALGTAATSANAAIVGSAAVGTAATSASKYPFGRVSGLPFLPGLTRDQYAWAAKGTNLLKPNLVKGVENPGPGQFGVTGAYYENKQRIARYNNDWKRFNRRVAGMQALNAGKSMAGMAAGAVGIGAGMNQMTREDGNNWDTVSGALYAVAGTAAMVDGPWGWGIAAGASIIGGIMQVIGSAKRSTDVYGEISEFAKQNAINNGIIAGSDNQQMQYLEAIKTKYEDINGLVEKRIELTAKLLGLQSGDNPMDASTGVYQSLMEKHEKLWDSDSLKAFNDMYGSRFNSDQHLVKYNGFYYLTSGEKLTGQYVSNGDGTSKYVVTDENGKEAIRAGNGTIGGMEAAFASMAATTEIMSPGGYYEKLVSGIQTNVAKMALKGSSLQEFDSYIDQIIKANDPQYLTNLIGLSDIKDTDWNLQRMLQDQQTREYMWTQLNAILEPMREAFTNFRNEIGTGDMQVSTLTAYLQSVIGNQPGLAIKDYNPDNIAGWYANYGFQNGTFNGYSVTDQNGVVTAYTAQEAAQMTISNMQSIIEAIRQSGAASEPAAIAMTNYCQTLLTQAQAFVDTNAELIDVAANQEIILNDQLYRWNALTQTYQAIGEDGSLMYIQSQVNGLGDSINWLGSSLGYDWTGTFGNISNGLGGMYNWLNTLGSIHFGSGYTPSLGFGLGGGTNFGGGTGTGSFNLLGGSSVGGFNWRTPKLSIGGSFGSGFNLFNRSNPIADALNRQTRSYRPNELTLSQMSNATANAGMSLGRNGVNNGVNNPVHTGTGTGGNGGAHGTKASDYKSHQKERAIPKQININIQNLMKVDSIDLTNPDNVAIIDRMKREVAYALYEAAADGTMMLNNLATS